MEADLNDYDLEHVCTSHPRMSREQWQATYHQAWSLYYTPAHMRTLLRRAAATGVPLGSLMRLLVRFALTTRLEGIHPLQGGILRLKHPSERRPGLPAERPWVFWPRLAWHTVRTFSVAALMIARLLWWKRSILRDARTTVYADAALSPVPDEEDAPLDLLTKTSGAQAAVAHIRKVAGLTGARGAA